MDAEKLKSRQKLKLCTMKKVVLFITAFCFCNLVVTQAQTNKGNWLSGVSSSLNIVGPGSDLLGVGFSTWKTKSDADGFEDPDPDKVTSINLLPKFGYFIADNFAFGIDLSLFTSTHKFGDSETKYSSTMFAVGPFARYYFPTAKAKPYLEANVSFGSMTDKYDPEVGETEKDKSSIMTYGGGVGIAAPVSNRVTFDVMVGYYSLTAKEKEDNDDNYRTVISTIGIKLGFIIFLGANE